MHHGRHLHRPGDHVAALAGAAPATDIWDIAGWAIALGIVGGRPYHVVTDYEKYFDDGKRSVDALKIHDGGLGIWGTVALGVLGAWIGYYRTGIRLSAFADAAAPGVAAVRRDVPASWPLR